MPLPNFFIVGAPKSGTTSLYHYLSQHPQIFLSPVKEPCYFASEVRLENFPEEYRKQIAADSAPSSDSRRLSGLRATWESYLELFDGVMDEIAIGEASVCYLWSPAAARNIRARIPGARIIAVLRHPVERAWSQYLQGLANGYFCRPFHECLQTFLAPAGPYFSPSHPFLEFGFYYQQVRKYFDLFPPESVRIYFHQDGLDSIVGDIFRFLGVDTAFRADLSQRHLEAAATGQSTALFRVLRKHNLWQPLRKLVPAPVRPAFRRLAFRERAADVVMTSEDRQFLCGYYREDVLRLASLLNRDLTAWLV